MTLDEIKQIIGDPASDEGFEQIQLEAEDLLQTGSISDQMDFANYLAGILADPVIGLATKDPKRYDDIYRYFALLSFTAFLAYSPQDKINLLQKKILYAIQKGFDPDILLKQFYTFYESPTFINDIFHSFAKYMEDNTEQFGSQPIEVDGRRMLPQLKYWLLDYAEFPSRVAKRGPVERLNYVNQSANTKALPQGQREILLRVLKLYDEFLNPNIPQRYFEPEDILSDLPGQSNVAAQSNLPEPLSISNPADFEDTTQAPRQIQAEPGSWQSSVEFGPMPQQTPQPKSQAQDDSALIRDKLDKLHERTGK
jgi:hypothetical protein